MGNSVLCTVCKKWIHGRCTREKRVNTRLAQDFMCSRCKMKAREGADQVEERSLCEGVERVNAFCYLGDRLNVSGGSEAAVTARMRVG